MCDRCGLWYFNAVPYQHVLRELLDAPSLGQRWAAEDRPTFRRARRAMRRWLDRPGTVLDIGAHSGGFLDTLDPKWNKSAVEPMLASSAVIAGVRVHAGFIEEVDLQSSCYDCITAFDVVEHFSDPAAAFARVARALRPGGIFILETGTVDALAARWLGAGWYYMNYLEHFQAFGSRSMQGLLERSGLEMVQHERVSPERLGLGERSLRMASVLAFATLTGGGRSARLWQSLHAAARPQSGALPPSTLALERDHLFVVARKPDAVPT